jgi:hypothetical protein
MQKTYSPNRINRHADRLIRTVDTEKQGTNGIGKAFKLRPQPDWTVLLALKFGPNGKRLAHA